MRRKYSRRKQGRPNCQPSSCVTAGGASEHLRPDAIVFARAGFLVVTIEYRGWGKSDARLIAKSKLIGRWVIQNPDLRKLTFKQGAQRTRGQIGYPEPFAKFGGMTGQPVWETLMQYAPIEDIGRCDACAKLFIIAENEELFDNKDHAIAAYNRANGVKKLVTIEGIKHYGIYNEKRSAAQQLAINWFREHLSAKE